MQTFSNCFGRLALILLTGSLLTPKAQADEFLKTGQKVVFLGDSNTYAGNFVADFDTLTRANGLTLQVFNVGLPSETCCGLSEPDHPFPRPTVQERIDRVLAKMQPDVVIACYGMNDGIYHPFSQERFQKYQAGIRELIGKVKKSGAKLILLTPPPFDPLPLRKKGKLVPADSKKFAWFQVFEGYDNVLKKYSEWILTLKPQVDLVIDIRSPIVQFLDSRRETSPEFTMSGDGVHFDATCHRIIADAIVKNLIQKPVLKIPTQVKSIANKKMQILRDAWLTETGHLRPGVKKGLPLDQAGKQVTQLDSQLKDLLAK